MDAKITEILVCPLCKGPLLWNEKKKEILLPFRHEGLPRH